MNRLKKELRKRGIKLASDYEHLPFCLKGSFMEPGNIFVDDIVVNSEEAKVIRYLNIGVEITTLKRNGEFSVDLV